MMTHLARDWVLTREGLSGSGRRKYIARYVGHRALSLSLSLSLFLSISLSLYLSPPLCVCVCVCVCVSGIT
ncbi:hypothetical protein LZ31DRAFT_18912 [Colletotrichum somersetense]|nr:hypothetical protein LZ31DRAFT_18912 [Colletotrichum somersetense]